jgi:hypothetical protein
VWALLKGPKIDTIGGIAFKFEDPHERANRGGKSNRTVTPLS